MIIQDKNQSPSNYIRTFLGIRINEENKIKLQNLIDCLKNNLNNAHISWQKASKLHITLRFLGNTTKDQLPTLIHHFSQAITPISPFSISLKNIQLFPLHGKSRYIALEVLPKDELQHLNKILELAAQQLGFPKDLKSFQAHLTLGKILLNSIPQLDVLLKYPVAQQIVNEIILFESQPGTQSTHYNALARLFLGQGEGSL